MDPRYLTIDLAVISRLG